jgi:acetyltransferase-like isoleucine patch superfamily enzyme
MLKRLNIHRRMTVMRAAHARFVEIGAGSVVARPVRFAQLSRGDRIVLGARTRMYRDGDITGPVTIGDDCFFNRSVYLRPNTTIGDRVSIGPFARLITDWHKVGGPEWRNGPSVYQPITVGDGAGIGAGVTVLPGVTIGAGAMVAAGSVVAKDVAPNTLVGGVPARVIRDLGTSNDPFNSAG